MNYQMISPYPCIFGFVALNTTSFFLKDEKPAETIYNDNKITGIYKRGKIKEFHLYKSEKNLLILIGRIYSPFNINLNIKGRGEYLSSLENVDLRNLQGNFLIIFKSVTNESSNLKIVSDKFGSRRLLYILKDKLLFFSTHISGLKILLKGKMPQISSEVLLHYYNFGFTPNHQTLIQDMHKLPPGSILSVEEGHLAIKKYFFIRDFYNKEKYKNCNEEVICQQIDDFMLDSIRKRNSDKHSVSVALSGGVDSGYIAQKLVQNDAKPICYNLAYNDYYNEYDRVENLGELLNLKIRKISISPNQIIKNFVYCNSISSEPMGFNNASMRFIALEAKKDGMSELFDGDGTDRIFLGMSRYLLIKKIIGIYSLLKKVHFYPVVMPLLNVIPGRDIKKLYIHFKNWNSGIYPYPERDMNGLEEYDSDYEQEVYDIAIRKFRREFEKEFAEEDFAAFFTYLSIQMCPEMFFYDPTELQTELGIFPISAFWDDNLVSLAISLPTELKIRKGQTKYILRKTAAKNIDSNYWMKSKIGLQSSFKYLSSSKEGFDWITIQHQKIRDSIEFKILKKMVPEGKVSLDKLVSLIVWKEVHLS